jgi:tetratricopeptide (TPR) repeat protein
MDNSTFNMDELLIRYLDGDLAGKEKLEFENRLSSNKTLQEELQSLQLTRDAVRSYGLKQKIASLHEKMMDELSAPVRKISPTRRFVQYSLAIAASLLLIFISIQAYTFFTLSPGKLFSQNYKSYGLNTVRGSGTEQTAIEKAYLEKKYAEVSGLAENSTDIEANFLAAMSNMELKNVSKAIEEYKKVITLNEAANTNVYKDESEYYLALAYMENKNYKESLSLMERIHEDPNHLYHEKISSKLIRKVKWLKWR